MAALPPLRLRAQLDNDLVDGSGGKRRKQDLYVLSLACTGPGHSSHSIAAALSSNTIKLFAAEHLALTSELSSAHEQRISELHFANTQADLLYSCSLDRTVKCWDRRSGDCVATYDVGDEVLSCSLSGDDRTLAASSNASVKLWDLRGGPGEASRVLTEAFTEPVTRVLFHGGSPSVLVTGDEDGLICLFDLSIADEDDCLQSVFNEVQHVADLGVFGAANEFLWVTSETETFSVWNAREEERVAHFEDARGELSRGAGRLQRETGAAFAAPAEEAGALVEYVVGGHQTAGLDLLLLAGNSEGGLVLSRVRRGALEPLQLLSGGHEATVRRAAWLPGLPVMVTGGEDGRLCMWGPGGEGPAAGSDAESSGAKGKKRQKLT
eukprot:tig00020911_g15716.t1